MRHDLLCQHIERVTQIMRGLNVAIDHSARDYGGFEQIATMLWEQLAATRFTHLMSGTANALQAAAHGARRLDLDHQIDGTHVDAKLEAAGGHDGAQQPALELIFDDHALFAGQRTVVSLHEFFGE